jgi:plastocyanin domain-containing protein
MKGIIFSTALASLFIVVAYMHSKSPASEIKPDYLPNSRIENGVQIIEIRARGGYEPRRSVAIADLPTILRFDSKGTFDCSTSVRIPSKNINMSLDFSGSTDVDIGLPKKGLMKGSCSMGMYPFEVEFVD